MVVLGIIPLRRRANLSSDGLPFVPLLADLLLYLFRNLLLIIVLVKYCRSVLCSCVGTLSVHRGRIVHPEKVLHELSVGNLLGVEGDQERFGVTCTTRANTPVIWCFGLATCVPYSAVEKTFALPILSV